MRNSNKLLQRSIATETTTTTTTAAAATTVNLAELTSATTNETTKQNTSKTETVLTTATATATRAAGTGTGAGAGRAANTIAAMAVVRKKQDDKYLLALRELVTTGGGGNRQCFDCGQKGPTYVNMTIGSFVCTRCSGVLRGLTPPHRVKSISMATFTQDEIDFLKTHGNELCAKTWLGLWDPKRAIHQDHRELMIDKYERKRYYLEPASPLKSLTNAVNLKASSTQSAALANASHSSNHSSSNSNNTASSGSSSTAHHNGHVSANGYASIQLTPPASQRTTANGLHKSSAAAAAMAISRPHREQHQQPQQQQQQNGYHHNQPHHDAFMSSSSSSNNNNNNNNHHHGLNGLHGLVSLNGAGSTSTGALSDTSSCASNGFGPDADFVADFGSANIFDATSASSVGSPAVSSASSIASSNGYAKIQPLKAAHQQQQQRHFVNGNANKNGLVNGNAISCNGSSSNNNNSNENFADFDHAPIYNAAGTPMPNGLNNKMGTASTASANNNSNNNNNSSSSNIHKTNPPTEDRYAALKDLDEQLRESKAITEAAATIVASSVVDAFGNATNNNNNPNPFKSQQLQQQAQSQQQQQQQNGGALINPFQAQNLFGQMTLIPNGYGSSAQQQQQQLQQQQQQLLLQQQHQQQQQQQQAMQSSPQAFFNYSNGGYAMASLAASAPGSSGSLFPHILGASMPNSCGFGGFAGMQQQQQQQPLAVAGVGAGGGIGMHGGVFNNPFAASGAINTNNPFL